MLVCVFVCAFCTRDRGCSAHPAFPAPSVLRERDIDGKPRAKHAAGSRSRILRSVDDEFVSREQRINARLRQGFRGHPASRSRRIQSCEAPWREAGWWGRKDSNLRSHKTADLQSAPFATRDTSPLNSITTRPGMAETRPWMTLKPRDPITGSPVAAFMAESTLQSQPTGAANPRPPGLKLPLSGTRETSLP
jgi:hypothetical protein